ncbi:MAG: site-specific DNA-methyltransferase [Phycisphaeraceae bacterium]|nr:site-specific DNA-methyltransferase [Phycisphaeraceae bacterium]
MPDAASQPQQPEKLDLRSMDIAEARQQELLRLFPEIRTEGGKLDFDRLKLALGQAVDVGRERYGMNWPGKADCFKTIQTPSMGTLRPCREESVNWDTTENLIIEGDNLEVLKLLQKSYLGKVKMIYIDPPYNTGSDFIYPDNYSESLDTYLEYTGQADSEGKKFGTNTEADGRFHSKWMNMMFPRLYLARNLLREDVVIFVSIDDHECTNLLRLCDEVFGEENRIACVANVNNPKGRSDDKYVATAHESLVIYKRAEVDLGGWEPPDKVTRRYNKADTAGRPYREIDLRKTGDADKREDRPNMFYFFVYNTKTSSLKASRESAAGPDEVIIRPARDDDSDGRWRWSLDEANKNIRELIAKWMPVRKMWGVFEKDFLEADERVKPTSVWALKEVNSERGTEQFLELGFDKEDFSRPKPVGLLRRILDIGTSKREDIVLDFFAGSGVTAQAVLEANAADGGSRRFVLVQLPEETDRPGFRTIVDVTKERVRRVLKKLQADDAEPLLPKSGGDLNDGFRVFKLDRSGFDSWESTVPTDGSSLEQQLEIHVEHIREGRSESDLLFEILLKSGFPVTTPVETLTLASKKVYSVAGGALMLCLERPLTMEVIRAIADKKPERVVCLDAGFAGNDQLKTNAVQIFKTKGVGSFKTV